MPFTPEFNKLRRRFKNQYQDNAKADTFAFMEAFSLKIPTFENRRKKFKKQGQSVLSGSLFFFMAIVCVALLMPTLRETIQNNTPSIANGTNGAFLSIIINFFPVFLVIMAFIIFVIIIRQ